MRISTAIPALSLLGLVAAWGRQPPLLTNVTVFDPPLNYTVPRTLYARVRALECSERDVLLATWENYLPTDDPDAPCPDNCPVNPYALATLSHRAFADASVGTSPSTKATTKAKLGRRDPKSTTKSTAGASATSPSSTK